MNKFEGFCVDYLGTRGNVFQNLKDDNKIKILFMFRPRSEAPGRAFPARANGSRRARGVWREDL